MAVPIFLAFLSVACFLALAHAGVTSPPESFRRLTGAMALVALALAVFSPGPATALLVPVLLTRQLVRPRVPGTVPELLDRYPARDG